MSTGNNLMHTRAPASEEERTLELRSKRGALIKHDQE